MKCIEIGITELTKALEDYRDDLVVIVAGYTDPMNKFFDSNPGLKARFNTFIEFEDYTSDELLSILLSMCKENNYVLSADIINDIKTYIDTQINNKTDNFANGRLMRNVYDDLVMNHAKRVVAMDNLTHEDLTVIRADDFMETNIPNEIC